MRDWQIPVFRTRSGKAYRSKYAQYLKDAAKEAGLIRKVRTSRIQGGHVEEGLVPLHEAISTHAARHTGASPIENGHGSAGAGQGAAGARGYRRHQHLCAPRSGAAGGVGEGRKTLLS